MPVVPPLRNLVPKIFQWYLSIGMKISPPSTLHPQVTLQHLVSALRKVARTIWWYFV